MVFATIKYAPKIISSVKKQVKFRLIVRNILVYIRLVILISEVKMKGKTLKILSFGIILTLFVGFNTTNAQRFNKIYEDIGGGTNSSNTSVSSNDDYILYIVGGLAVGGIIAYALLRDKKEKQKKDTTAVIFNDDFLEKNLSFREKTLNMESQIPINIFLGMQGNRAIRDERRYFVGLNYNF